MNSSSFSSLAMFTAGVGVGAGFFLLKNIFSKETKKETAKPNRPLLMIPGPVEFSPEVLEEVSNRSLSHMSPEFAEKYQRALLGFKQLIYAPDGMPYIIAGSGTSGWDIVATNLLGPKSRVLVLSTGFFGDSFASCLRLYGNDVTTLEPAQVGESVSMESLEAALNSDFFDLVTITQVDTSSAVLSDVKAIADVVHSIQPNCLIAVDGVCSFGGEEFRFSEWGIDAAITAPQKCVGCPPGLVMLMLSPRAVEKRVDLGAKRGYYFNLDLWTPVMESCLKAQPAYFATPPVNLISALDTSLQRLLNIGVDKLVNKHQQAAAEFRAHVQRLGLQVVAKEGCRANTLTTIYLPEGVTAPDLITKLKAKGVVVAGGLHKDIKTRSFRVGHMGYSVTEPNCNHLQILMRALEETLLELKK